MKKYLIVATLAITMMVVSACGNDNKDKTTTAVETTVEETTVAETTVQETTVEETKRTDNSCCYGKSNRSSYKGC